jgi:hypothetical protein
MPKRSRGIARRRIARTPGQSASALDNEFLHGETDKTSDLALDTVGPGEVMSGNQGVKISDDQNSLKAGLRGPTRASACGRLPMRKSARSSDFFHRGSAPVGDGTTLPQRRGTRRSGRRCILDKRVRLPPAALCGIARGRKSQAKEGGLCLIDIKEAVAGGRAASSRDQNGDRAFSYIVIENIFISGFRKSDPYYIITVLLKNIGYYRVTKFLFKIDRAERLTCEDAFDQLIEHHVSDRVANLVRQVAEGAVRTSMIRVRVSAAAR